MRFQNCFLFKKFFDFSLGLIFFWEILECEMHLRGIVISANQIRVFRVGPMLLAKIISALIG